jgi:hypothetical protein
MCLVFACTEYPACSVAACQCLFWRLTLGAGGLGGPGAGAVADQPDRVPPVLRRQCHEAGIRAYKTRVVVVVLTRALKKECLMFPTAAADEVVTNTFRSEGSVRTQQLSAFEPPQDTLLRGQSPAKAAARNPSWTTWICDSHSRAAPAPSHRLVHASRGPSRTGTTGSTDFRSREACETACRPVRTDCKPIFGRKSIR